MGNKPKMLICEDAEMTAKELEKIFEGEYEVRVGYEVDMCIRLLQANRKIQNPNDRIAIAIIDLSFKCQPEPNTQGFEILNEVQKDPFLEPVVFTGTGEDVDKVIASHELGAFRYVMKGKEAKDGRALEEGSIAKLKKAVAEATECWRRLVNLDTALGLLMRTRPDDQDILPHARFVFDYIQRIRGRYPRE